MKKQQQGSVTLSVRLSVETLILVFYVEVVMLDILLEFLKFQTSPFDFNN